MRQAERRYLISLPLSCHPYDGELFYQREGGGGDTGSPPHKMFDRNKSIIVFLRFFIIIIFANQPFKHLESKLEPQ